jgi:uncharacterized protein with FMN-binding domain
MRRALTATAATVVGLVALLDYRSSSSGVRRVSIPGASPATTSPTSTGGAAPTTQPTSSTTSPAAGPPPVSTTIPAPKKATYTGQDVSYRYGDIQLAVTVVGGRITAIDVPQESATDARSQSINSQAVPILTQEALSAQGVNIDVVSGATYTSDAFAQALQSALAQESA